MVGNQVDNRTPISLRFSLALPSVEARGGGVSEEGVNGEAQLNRTV
jgi:hypothetical protein